MKPLTTIQWITSFIIIVVSIPLKAQPLAPTQWHQINTPHIKLIFRGGIEQEAQRLANTLEHLYEPISKSLGAQPSQISLTLWNQIFESNGHFALVPRRINFFNGPSQDYNFVGTNSWFNVLAVHEFRHAVQHAKLQQNFNQLFYWLGGDMALNALMHTLVPKWFFEGDAVGIETALTKSGRGRIPKFSLLYKVNLLERGGFSYYKQILGSFNHQIPDHYRVGYYLTTHLRRKYGADVLGNIFEKTTQPMFLSTAVKKVTGKSLLQTYEDTNQELKELWQKQLEGLKITSATSLITRSHEAYTDYDYPQLDQAGNLIVLKSGIGTTAQLVALDEHGKERLLFIPGKLHTGVSFSVAQGQIVWTESIPHPRWEDHHYGVIQRYDISQNRLKTLTHQSRYSTAALSPDATKIVAVESDEYYQHRVVILEAGTGKVLHRLPNPDNYFYLTPRWLANGRLVVAVKNSQQKATLTLIDALTGETQDLLPYSEENIGAPVAYGQYIFYNSAYNGIDNIYALDLASHRRYQVTSRKYGAYNPVISADGQWIIFNDFTKDGMDVVKMPLAPQQWTPLEEVEDRTTHYYAPLVTQENNGDVLEHVPNQTYPVAPYYPWKHLFNVHSWTWPLPTGTASGVGFMIQSNDLFNTTEASAGYLYDIEKRTKNTFANLSYKAWYPIISLEGKAIQGYQSIDMKKNRDTEKQIGLSLSLPLTFQQGQYTHRFLLSTKSTLSIGNQIDSFQTYEGKVLRTAKKSPRDLYPPWQQKLEVAYSHPLYVEPTHRARLITTTLRVQAELIFPGLFEHHSAQLSPQYIHERINIAHYESKSNEGFPMHTCAIQGAYHWPIYYPDWNLGNWLYVKRLNGHALYTLKYQSEIEIQENYQLQMGVNMDIDFPFVPILHLRAGGVVAYSQNHFRFWPTLFFYVSP